MVEVIIFFAGILMAMIPSITRVYVKDKLPFYRNITFAGYLLIVIFFIYVIVGIYNISNNNRKEEYYIAKDAESAQKMDSLSSLARNLSSEIKSYKSVLNTMGYKLDSSYNENTKNADSIKSLIKNQKFPIDQTKASIEICMMNLIRKEYPETSRLQIKLCSGEKNINDLKIKYYSIAKKDAYNVIPSKAGRYLVDIETYGANQERIVEILYPLTKQFNDTLFLYLTGTFKDDYNRPYTFIQYCIFEPGDTQFGGMMKTHLSLPGLKEFLKKEGF